MFMYRTHKISSLSFSWLPGTPQAPFSPLVHTCVQGPWGRSSGHPETGVPPLHVDPQQEILRHTLSSTKPHFSP